MVSLFNLPGPTEPAGSPSFRGLPTGLLILGGKISPASKFFFVLPFGRPGRLFVGVPSGLNIGALPPDTGSWSLTLSDETLGWGW